MNNRFFDKSTLVKGWVATNVVLFIGLEYYFRPTEPAYYTSEHELYDQGMYPYRSESVGKSFAAVLGLNVALAVVAYLTGSLKETKNDEVSLSNKR